MQATTTVSPYIENKEPSTNFQEVFIEADGAKLFCRVIGKGSPIVVIHGGPGLTQDYLLPQMAKLGENNLVIFYDQRCCGLSTGTIDERSLSVKTFLNDLESIRKTFGYKKITVLGHSWGGFLAMQYALSYPKSVDKMVLLNTAPASLEEYQLFLKEVDRRTAPYQADLKAIQETKEFAEAQREPTEKYYKIVFSTYFCDPSKINFLNFHMSNSNEKKVFDIFHQDVLLKPFDLHEQLKKLHIPTLIIHGDSDVIPSVTAKEIHESISHSEYVLLKNCGHFSYIEDPDDLFLCLNAFLHPEENMQKPSIEVTSDVSLLDQDTTMVVRHLNPGEIISMKAESIDDLNTLWTSYASFRADKNGVVDLSSQSPLEGTYSGIDAMGLLWSMQSEKGPSASFSVKNEQFSIVLKVFRGNQEIASKEIIRLLKSPEVKRVPVREKGLVGTLFLPPSEKPLPVIITLSGSNGGIGESKSKLLASHGFAVFALGYFGVEGLPSKLQNIPLEYFETAFSWIKSQPNLDGSHIGIYGGSRGGELALLLGATFPQAIQSIVAAVPSSVVYGSCGEVNDIPTYAWIYHGKPIAPFAHEVLSLFGDIGKNFDHPFHETPGFLEGMKDTKSFNAAAIPVENIRASLLLISGGDDQMWPSGLYSFQIEERLRKSKSSIFWQHLHYPKAGHGITLPYLPESSTLLYHPVAKIWCSLGGSVAENRYACQDSWKKIIVFFEETLKLKKCKAMSENLTDEDKIHFVSQANAEKCQNSPSCVVYEYPMKEKEINGALAVISSRYPDSGCICNQKCKEMCYVVKGFGKVVIEGKEHLLSEGDVVFIDKKENFFWEGNMTLFVVCTPAWTLEQYQHIP